MKKQSVVVFLFVQLFVLVFQSCEFLPIWEQDIMYAIDNQSEDTISVYYAIGYFPPYPTVFPDTLLPRKETVVTWEEDSTSTITTVPPKMSYAVLTTIERGNYWASYDDVQYKFFHNRCHLDTLSFFVMSHDSIRKYGYDYVTEHNMVLVRYDLSFSDLKALRYVVPYPPNEKTQGMKIRNYLK